MARSIAEIHNDIILSIRQRSELAGLNSTSKFAIFRLIAYCVAIAIWTLEKLFDLHTAEINTILGTQKAHGLRWYVGIAKAFRYGVALNDEGEYVGDADENTLIIAEASATEQNNAIVLKVAKRTNNFLAPLDSVEKQAFNAYITETKDAGVRLAVQSIQGDKFKIAATIYRDPLVLDEQGRRLDGTNDNPVRDAVLGYIQSLPFDGILIAQKVIDAIQLTEGVVTVEVNAIGCNRFDVNGYAPIGAYYRTTSGYFDLQVAITTFNYQLII